MGKGPCMISKSRGLKRKKRGFVRAVDPLCSALLCFIMKSVIGVVLHNFRSLESICDDDDDGLVVLVCLISKPNRFDFPHLFTWRGNSEGLLGQLLFQPLLVDEMLQDDGFEPQLTKKPWWVDEMLVFLSRNGDGGSKFPLEKVSEMMETNSRRCHGCQMNEILEKMDKIYLSFKRKGMYVLDDPLDIIGLATQQDESELLFFMLEDHFLTSMVAVAVVVVVLIVIIMVDEMLVFFSRNGDGGAKPHLEKVSEMMKCMAQIPETLINNLTVLENHCQIIDFPATV
ncbi:hypothetical protein Sjap_010939 [Stephania japonica]|uniref:Uncharacterized protein n=1 Tax=Stephania japonica TaxID=461633 RepID=A0AAP0JA51_9MAGN